MVGSIWVSKNSKKKTTVGEIEEKKGVPENLLKKLERKSVGQV